MISAMLAFINATIGVTKEIKNSLIIYKASRRDPSITIIPTQAPATVGQEVPEFGSSGAGVPVFLGVATGVDVAQVQVEFVWQAVFLQLPVVAPAPI